MDNGSTGQLPWLDASAIERLLPMPAAIETLETALRGGLDPAVGTPRSVIDTSSGQLLLMPSESAGSVGVKLVTVAAGNPAVGLPRIQGIYVLLDGATLRPLALLDGIAITSLRTPAMSAVAVRLLAPARATTLVVFGAGPQAWGHVEAVRAVRPLTDVVVVGRDPGRAAQLVDRVAASGLRARPGSPDDVASTDVVVCATTAAEPLFAGRLVSDGACVVAVGSHEPDRRELDEQLLGRSLVAVEDVATALREAGDVVQAVAAGALAAADLVGIADLVHGRWTASPDQPRVFKSVGMAWQDLVTAEEVARRAGLLD